MALGKMSKGIAKKVVAKSAPKLNLNAQQIKAIKASRAGQLPQFLAGKYDDGTVGSIGGRVRGAKNSYGMDIVYDKSKKQLFGSVNKNSKITKSFGPQD